MQRYLQNSQLQVSTQDYIPSKVLDNIYQNNKKDNPNEEKRAHNNDVGIYQQQYLSTQENIHSRVEKAKNDLLLDEGTTAAGDDKGADVILTEDSQFKAYLEEKNREQRSDSQLWADLIKNDENQQNQENEIAQGNEDGVDYQDNLLTDYEAIIEKTLKELQDLKKNKVQRADSLQNKPQLVLDDNNTSYMETVSSQAPNGTFEIDLDEIQDRVDLLYETVEQLGSDDQRIEVVKISISSFCIERAKIQRLIFRFRTVRKIRENEEMMSELEKAEKELAQVSLRAEELIGTWQQSEFYKHCQEQENLRYDIQKLKENQDQINTAFDSLKCSVNNKSISLQKKQVKKQHGFKNNLKSILAMRQYDQQNTSKLNITNDSFGLNYRSNIPTESQPIKLEIVDISQDITSQINLDETQRRTSDQFSDNIFGGLLNSNGQQSYLRPEQLGSHQFVSGKSYMAPKSILNQSDLYQPSIQSNIENQNVHNDISADQPMIDDVDDDDNCLRRTANQVRQMRMNKEAAVERQQKLLSMIKEDGGEDKINSISDWEVLESMQYEGKNTIEDNNQRLHGATERGIALTKPLLDPNSMQFLTIEETNNDDGDISSSQNESQGMSFDASQSQTQSTTSSRRRQHRHQTEKKKQNTDEHGGESEQQQQIEEKKRQISLSKISSMLESQGTYEVHSAQAFPLSPKSDDGRELRASAISGQDDISPGNDLGSMKARQMKKKNRRKTIEQSQNLPFDNSEGGGCCQKKQCQIF